MWVSTDWSLLPAKSRSELINLSVEQQAQIFQKCSLNNAPDVSELKILSLENIYGAIQRDFTGDAQFLKHRSRNDPINKYFDNSTVLSPRKLHSSRPKDFFMRLPIEVSTFVLTYLDSVSLHHLSCCSTDLAEDCRSIIPGLKLRLFPHQYNSGIVPRILFSFLFIFF